MCEGRPREGGMLQICCVLRAFDHVVKGDVREFIVFSMHPNDFSGSDGFELRVVNSV